MLHYFSFHTMKYRWLILLLLPVLISDAQDFSEIEIKTIKVTDHIYMLEGSGGNIAVSVGEDGALMVDSQYAPLSEKIRQAIKALTDRPVKLLLNTHWHGDHSGGNENFGQQGAMIIAHENVKERLSKTQLIRAFSREIPPAPEMARPVVTFSDQLSVKCNGEYVMMIHVDSAHTDGDALIYFPESDVMHLGDTYFNGRYPFIDLSSGGRINGMIAAAEQALFVAGEHTKIIPGHGPLSNKAELETYHQILKSIRDKVKQAIDEGKDLEAIQAMRPGAETDEVWGAYFITPDRFVEFIYNSFQVGG